MSVRPLSLLAPASMSKDTHLRFPFEAAAHSGVIASASSKLGFRGWVQVLLKKFIIIFLTCHYDFPIWFHFRRPETPFSQAAQLLGPKF